MIIDQNSSNLIFKITGLLKRRPVIYQFLRFSCIGFLNTALNFLIFNALSKALNISQGWPLGGVEAVAFGAALIQSYLWNRTWTFGSEQGVSLRRNVTRLLAVGALGVLTVLTIYVSSGFSAPATFYVAVLVVYLALETVLWRTFNFHLSDFDHVAHSFLIFLIVTLIGWSINVSLTSVISSNLHLTNTDLDKNIAVSLATAVSLFWNFIGYKAVVFKK